MKEKVRIAAGQGFWGDRPDAPVPLSLVQTSLNHSGPHI